MWNSWNRRGVAAIDSYYTEGFEAQGVPVVNVKNGGNAVEDALMGMLGHGMATS
jgi:hypothetical protein